MSLDLLQPEVAFAHTNLWRAAAMSRAIQAESATLKLEKDDKSPVTVADFAVQAVIARALAESFPSARLVGEENSDALTGESAGPLRSAIARFASMVFEDADKDVICDWIDSGSGEATKDFWTLDPIDGTKGFLRGEQYALALARIVDGTVVFGALACPNLVLDDNDSAPGAVLIAQSGSGTWVATDPEGDYRRVTVSEVSDPRECRLLRSVESGHTNVSQIDHIAEHLSIQASPVCLDSQAKYAVLATGRGDGLLRLLSPKKPDYRECIWDQAAGSIVVEEAGGRVTDLSGASLDFSHGERLLANRGVCASNGALHDALLGAVAATSD